VTGESHYFVGRRYRLNVVEQKGNPQIRLASNSIMEVRVPPGSDRTARRVILDRWYRRQLKSLIPDLLARWQPIVGADVADCRIKRMKTRWGSCNIEARRVWLNLELIKKPRPCLEYILVHEMVHLLERRHTERFSQLMDQLMPDWKTRRAKLNKAPLAHEDWEY